jgi:hypothetical protein
MSTIWTPGGERPVGQQPSQPAGGEAGVQPEEELTEEEMAARMGELREQLAQTPAELVIANHCYGLFELAALHLSVQPPQLEQAQLAIDGLGLLVEGLASRLGEPEHELQEGLSQLRLAFVQIRAGLEDAGDAVPDTSPEGPPA